MKENKLCPQPENLIAGVPEILLAGMNVGASNVCDELCVGEWLSLSSSPSSPPELVGSGLAYRAFNLVHTASAVSRVGEWGYNAFVFNQRNGLSRLDRQAQAGFIRDFDQKLKQSPNGVAVLCFHYTIANYLMEKYPDNPLVKVFLFHQNAGLLNPDKNGIYQPLSGGVISPYPESLAVLMIKTRGDYDRDYDSYSDEEYGLAIPLMAPPNLAFNFVYDDAKRQDFLQNPESGPIELLWLPSGSGLRPDKLQALLKTLDPNIFHLTVNLWTNQGLYDYIKFRYGGLITQKKVDFICQKEPCQAYNEVVAALAKTHLTYGVPGVWLRWCYSLGIPLLVDVDTRGQPEKDNLAHFIDKGFPAVPIGFLTTLLDAERGKLASVEKIRFLYNSLKAGRIINPSAEGKEAAVLINSFMTGKNKPDLNV